MGVSIERVKCRKSKYYGLCGARFVDVVIAKITVKSRGYGLMGFVFSHKYRIYVDGELIHYAESTEYQDLIKWFHEARDKVISDNGECISRIFYAL